MRSLGLDIGEKRVGVAVSDPDGRVATPLKVIDAARLAADAAPLLRIAEDYEVDELVVGLPVSMSGEEGPQAARVRETAGRLSERLHLPITFFDERLSSAEAARVMKESGVKEKDRRGSLDMLAASIVLQAYLDSKRGE